MTDICIRHPEFCNREKRFATSQSFGSSRIHKNEFRGTVPTESVTPSTNQTRRFGVRETTQTPRRIGVRELQLPPDRTEPTVRRFGIRETGTESKFGKHIRKQRGGGDPPAALRGVAKKYNKKLAAFKEKQLKNLDLGLQESLESIEQHKYARLAQGAYDQAYKSKAKAMKGL